VAPASEWLLIPRLPRRSPEIVSVWTLGILGTLGLITPSPDI